MTFHYKPALSFISTLKGYETYGGHMVICLATDVCLTADPGVASSILA